MAIQQDDHGTTDLGVTEADLAAIQEELEPLWRIRLRLTWQQFKKNWGLFSENKIGLVGLAIIVVFALMALAYPVLTTWGPWQDLSIYHPVVGYDAPVLEIEVVATPADVTNPVTQMDVGRARLFDLTINVGDTLETPLQPAPPSAKHWLGTDPLGRDIASQLTFSTRSAFFLGFVAAIVTVVVATSVGSMAAHYGGWLDSALMRLADLVLLLPLIPILIVLSGMWKVNLVILGVLIGILSGFGGAAIVLKSQALSVKVKPFIDAARVGGGSNRRIILRHIIPNVLPLSFLYMMFTVTEAVSLEATLSFFGLLNIPMSWGIMINTASTQGYLRTGLDFWWLLLPAGLAVTFLAAAFFLVGRAMDEVINPRLRRR